MSIDELDDWLLTQDARANKEITRSMGVLFSFINYLLEKSAAHNNTE